MVIQITGVFDSYDTAERALRNLEGIPLIKSRIVSLGQTSHRPRKQNFDTIFTDYPADLFAYSGVGQGLEQSIVITPAILSDPELHEPSQTLEARLEVQVNDADAHLTEEHLINDHAYDLHIG